MTKFHEFIKHHSFMVQILALIVIYFVMGKLGMFLAVPPGYATAIYPPSGIALAGILLFGYRAGFGVFLGSFLLNLSIADSHAPITTYIPVLMAFVIALGATLQSIAGAYLVKRFADFPNPLANEKNVFTFMFYGGFLSTLVNSTISVSTLAVMNQIPLTNFFNNWSTWWIGDAIGVFIFAPLMIFWLHPEKDYFCHRKWVISLTIVAAFSLTVLFVIFETDREINQLKTEFDNDAFALNVELNKSIDTHLSVLRSLESFYASSENVGRDEFHKFVSQPWIDFRYVQALGWNRVVRDTERETFEKSMQKEGFSSFEIKERDVNNNLIRANSREFYVPATFIEPLKNNESALGYDVYSNPNRREAIEAARDTGEIATTAKTTLVQDNQAGFLAFVPIYKNNLPHENLQERRQNILGFALAVFHLNDIFTVALSHTHVENLHLQVFDDNAPTQEQRLLFSNQPTPFVLHEKGLFGRNISLTSSTLLKMGNRQWRCEITPTQDYFAHHRADTAWLILLAGLILTSTVGSFVMVLTGREMTLQQLVNKRTLALGESENRFRSIIEHSPIPIALNDNYQNIIFLNQAFTETFGYDLNDIPKLDLWWNKAYPDENYRKWVIETWEQTLTIAKQENKVFCPFEINVICKDGSQKVVIASASMLSELVDYHLVTLYDITERKKSELLVQESEKRFRTVADAAPVLIWLANTDKLCIWFNKTWLNFTGRTLEQEYGNGWAEGVHPDDFQSCLDTYITCFDNKQSFSMEYRLKNSQGEYRWLLDTGVPVFNTTGEFEGYIGSCVDIHNQKQLTQALKRSEHRLTEIINLLPIPVFIKDNQSRIKLVNRACEEQWGISFSELENTTGSHIFPAEQMEIFLDADKRIFLERELVELEEYVWNAKLQTNRIVHTLKKPVFDDFGNPDYLIGTAVDITQAKEYESSILEAKELAESLAKSKSEFLANMSHEIRTPMTAIIGLSQLSLNKEMPDDVRDSLTKIYQSSNSLLGILNDILDFSKLDAGKLTLENSAFSLVTVFHNLHNLFSVSAKNKNLAFSISVEDDVPNELIGDALRIQQILSNLLGNAIKFTDHGKIELRIKQIENRVNEAVLRFSVEDTGIGINTEHQENLFKPFHQADNSITRRFGGTGLGLTISRDLLVLMGSDFHINSVEAKGTTIYFDLLLKIPNTESVSLPTNQQQGTLQKKLAEMSKSLAETKILLAEDNFLNQEIVSGFLKMSGIEVDIAENGVIVLELLKSNSYDAILMDIHMPEMDGIQATKAIREQSKYADLPIIALTAGITVEEQEKCLSVGMNSLVEKPINPEVLLQTLNKLVKK